MTVIIGLHSGHIVIHVRDVPHARRIMDTARRHGRPAVLHWTLKPCPTARENGPSLRPHATAR